MHVAVVGGGITGLTVAWELLRLGHRVTIIEREALGGLAAGFAYPNVPEVYLERFYHHLFTSDLAIQNLIAELGLAADLFWRPTLSGVIARGRCWPLRGPFDLLRFAPLGSIWDRLRLGWAMFRLKKIPRWETLDSISCREYFEQQGAIRGYELFWLPLLKLKFADFAERASAAFLWGRITPRVGSRRGGQEFLGYLRGGFQRLFRKWGRQLREMGAEIVLGEKIDALRPGNCPELHFAGQWHRFDRVVWTASTQALHRVLPPEFQEFAQSRGTVEYLAATALILAVRRQQTPFYWLNSLDSDLTFGALIEHTNLADSADYGGDRILYVANYHAPGDPRFEGKGPEELLAYHLPSLQRICPHLGPADIRQVFSASDRFATPVYQVGYRQQIPPQRDFLPGVDLCNMSQVYPFDRNMNHCVVNAQRFIESFHAESLG